jgi:subtilisin-like proprotein convertase family protein
VLCGFSQSTTISTMTITDPGVVLGVRVMVDMAHSWVGDLEIRLRHVPTGTVVYLVDEPVDDTGDNWGMLNGVYTFVDGAQPLPDPAQQVLIDPGSYAPEESLSAFVGEVLAGVWQLEVEDKCPGDIGLVRGVTLVLGTACKGTGGCDGVCDRGTCGC